MNAIKSYILYSTKFQERHNLTTLVMSNYSFKLALKTHSTCLILTHTLFDTIRLLSLQWQLNFLFPRPQDKMQVWFLKCNSHE